MNLRLMLWRNLYLSAVCDVYNLIRVMVFFYLSRGTFINQKLPPNYVQLHIKKHTRISGNFASRGIHNWTSRRYSKNEPSQIVHIRKKMFLWTLIKIINRAFHDSRLGTFYFLIFFVRYKKAFSYFFRDIWWW